MVLQKVMDLNSDLGAMTKISVAKQVGAITGLIGKIIDKISKMVGIN
jgi:hypothetical protein